MMEQPMWSTPPFIAIAITWIGFLVVILRFRMELRAQQQTAEKLTKERDRELEDMALRVCRNFIASREYKQDRDERIRELGVDMIADAFMRRAPSFVSAEKFDERMRALEAKQTEMNATLIENTKQLANLSGQITQAVTQAVTQQLTMYLTTEVFGPKKS